MATKLFLRNTTNAGIGTYYDMLTAAGAAGANAVVNTAASGTEIQWTRTAGGTVLEFISGRVPAGGFTLAGTMNFSIWAKESNALANVGARARVFKRTAAGSESEVAGGPWNDGVEFGTANTEMTWTGTPTSTAFAEDDRIICRYYITNVGTMASGYTATLNYNAADAANGDSFFQINETVAFKGEDQTLTPSLFTDAETIYAPTVTRGAVTLLPALFSNSNSFYAPTVTPGPVTLTPARFNNSNTFYAPAIGLALEPALFNNSNVFYAPTVTPGAMTVTPELFSNSNSFYVPEVTPGAATLTPDLFSNPNEFYGPTAVTITSIFPTRMDNEQRFFAALAIAVSNEQLANDDCQAVRPAEWRRAQLKSQRAARRLAEKRSTNRQ